MFEYMNPGFMIFSGFFLFLTIAITLIELGRREKLKTKFRIHYPVYIAAIIIFGIAISDMRSTEATVIENKK
jgi:hypothetical protein